MYISYVAYDRTDCIFVHRNDTTLFDPSDEYKLKP
jgi:hypothetical protein